MPSVDLLSDVYHMAFEFKMMEMATNPLMMVQIAPKHVGVIIL